MADLKEINDDQNYEIVVDTIMIPSGTLRKGEVLNGKTLKAVLVYNLSPNQSLTSFMKETNKRITN